MFTWQFDKFLNVFDSAIVQEPIEDCIAYLNTIDKNTSRSSRCAGIIGIKISLH